MPCSLLHIDALGLDLLGASVNKKGRPENSRPLVERPFLREKRPSNAQGRGLCEAKAGHAPRAMVC